MIGARCDLVDGSGARTSPARGVPLPRVNLTNT